MMLFVDERMSQLHVQQCSNSFTHFRQMLCPHGMIIITSWRGGIYNNQIYLHMYSFHTIDIVNTIVFILGPGTRIGSYMIATQYNTHASMHI